MAFSNLQSNSIRFLSFPVIAIVEIVSLGFLTSNSAFAQIVPDRTLPNPSQVTIEDNTYAIEGGTTAGNNLFHSFENFSVPTGAEAFFNNTTTVENILTRVTGGNISNIDGLIRANGTANLFLLNPNGIVFGENARLDVGGSFLATTADSLTFGNGMEFSANDPNASPLLSVSVPVGLQWSGQGAEAIEVRGNGHGFTTQDPTFAPIERTQPVATGLQVPPQSTLALVGGNINLIGGTLTAESGRIELGAVAGTVPTRVELTPMATGWELNYAGVEGFGDISLSQQAAADVSGAGGGEIQIAGRRLTLTDGSVALIQTFGGRSGGLLQVETTEAVNLVGTNPEVTVRSTLRTETFSDSRGADISVETQRLSITDGAWILVTVFGEGDGGDVSVNAPESTEVSGFAPNRPDIFSILSSATFAPGDSGNITLSTGRLTLLDGGSLSSPAFFSTGNSGDVIVNATESIEMAGVTPLVFNPSSIAATSVGFGNGGTLTVNTPRLLVRDGAILSTSTLADGVAGNVFVNATESIEVTGAASGSDGASLPAQIGSDAFLADPALQAFLGIPSIPSGDAGNATINTPRLIVSDGAEVTVANEGTGRAGNLTINADSILLLDSDAGITASTVSGEGGNIILNADRLQLRNESQITTEAGGSGNGGNIILNVETISALENSRINANAFEGSGGNIRITAEGIFFSPDSAITASSQLGIDGLIEITQPEVDTQSGLVELSSQPIDPTTQVVSGCDVADRNTFVVVGNGGLPPDPTEVLHSRTIWTDLRLTEVRPSSVESGNEERSPSTELDSSQPPLVEATGWQRREDGAMELVSIPPNRVRSAWGDRSNCSERF